MMKPATPEMTINMAKIYGAECQIIEVAKLALTTEELKATGLKTQVEKIYARAASIAAEEFDPKDLNGMLPYELVQLVL